MYMTNPVVSSIQLAQLPASVLTVLLTLALKLLLSLLLLPCGDSAHAVWFAVHCETSHCQPKMPQEQQRKPASHVYFSMCLNYYYNIYLHLRY
jgi:hypothetical protein